VLLIEAETPEMICSVLLLSDDGNHIRHGAAPSLPENYVKAIDGSPIGPKHGLMWDGDVSRKPVIVTDIFYRPTVGGIPRLCIRDWCRRLLVNPDNVEQRPKCLVRLPCITASRGPRLAKRVASQT